MCEADINLSVIQNVMGHKEIKTTLEIYTHITEAKKRQEVDVLETMFAWT
ncbi:MAG: tyrosine-type recombinase/integrase [Clostridia bacterium]|nr:tyrosine-type recombinase/integrase [Clostridia bacterium]